MNDLIKSHFRFLISYRFQNNFGHVRTCWLDTFDRRFHGRSGTQTYTIYQRVASQYYNYQMGLIGDDSILNKINSVVARLLEMFPINPDFEEYMIRQSVVDFLQKYNENNQRYSTHFYEPLVYINYQLTDFNRFVASLSHLIDTRFQIPLLHHFQDIKSISPPVIHPWIERTPILTHKKGHRGFVKDYGYWTHW